ncbi:MAG: N-acetyltransferase [Chitinophagaceae bacterium]|nr:MAG: N-acetyltransferase [Chitinophagaceae bacterium]
MLYDKYFGDGFQLETNRVILRLMKQEDFDALRALTHDRDTWTWFNVDLSVEGELEKWMEEAFEDRRKGVRMPMVIIDKDTGEIGGCTSYGNISFPHSRIEIGWTWLGPGYLGMGVNRQAKFALLSFAFEVMKMERVEIKTDVLNERSRAAILKIGMIPEGVLRSHTLMYGNRRRDTIYFSILRAEWPVRKQSFFSDMV